MDPMEEGVGTIFPKPIRIDYQFSLRIPDDEFLLEDTLTGRGILVEEEEEKGEGPDENEGICIYIHYLYH